MCVYVTETCACALQGKDAQETNIDEVQPDPAVLEQVSATVSPDNGRV